MKKNNLKKINSQKIKKILGNIFSSIGSKFKKIKPVEFGVGAVVIVLSCVVIVPSLVQCVINRNKAKCSTHMSIMLNMLSDEAYGRNENRQNNIGTTLSKTEIIKN